VFIKEASEESLIQASVTNILDDMVSQEAQASHHCRTEYVHALLDELGTKPDRQSLDLVLDGDLTKRGVTRDDLLMELSIRTHAFGHPLTNHEVGIQSE